MTKRHTLKHKRSYKQSKKGIDIIYGNKHIVYDNFIFRYEAAISKLAYEKQQQAIEVQIVSGRNLSFFSLAFSIYN